MSEKQKMTIMDFKKFKEEGKKFAYVTAYDYTMASIVNDSDIEIILVGDSLGMIMLGYASTTPVTMEEMIHHIRPVVKGAPNTWIVGDMPFGSYHESDEQAVHNAVRLVKETGCDCVKLEGGVEMASRIKAIVNSGILVMGHIGLTPQTATAVGGFKVQGGTPESAKKLIEDAKILEECGAFSIVLECVPKGVAKVVRDSVKVPILGIGAGPDVDCQVLVTQDLLGMYDGFKPKFVKQYAHISTDIERAVKTYIKEMNESSFPEKKHTFTIDEDVLKNLSK